MKHVLLVAAAGIAAIAPSMASADPPSSNGGNLTFYSGKSGFHGDFKGHRRGDRRGGDIVVGWGGYGGEWALYNNRSWESDSYNDWWHDRPDRAFPRWMQNNQQCDRMWWGGGVWRC